MKKRLYVLGFSVFLLVAIVVIGLVTEIGGRFIKDLQSPVEYAKTETTQLNVESSEEKITSDDITTEKLTEENNGNDTEEITTETIALYQGEHFFADLSYGVNERNTYDLYLPQNMKLGESQGFILMIHGGSWVRGKKESMSVYCEELCEAGFITATMNYTLCTNDGNATVETMLDEISACILAIKRKTNELGLSVDNMAISGASAGGHLALLYAYRRAEVAAIPVRFVFQEVAPIDFKMQSWGLGMSDTTTFSDQSKYLEYLNMLTGENYTIDDLVDNNMDANVIALSPCTYMDDNSIPTIMAYGGLDATIGSIHPEILLNKLDEFGIPYEYILFENSGHALDKDPDKMKELYQTVKDYSERYFVIEE